MAALDFPSNPSINDTYSANGKTFVWNGTSWVNNSFVSGFTGSQGDIGFTGSSGFTGSKGADGNFGGATFDYTFNTDTTNSDPGVGNLKFNNATLSSATAMYIDDADDASTDIQTFLRTIDDSTSGIKGHFRVANKANPDDFALFTISSISEPSGYFVVNCAYVSGSATSFSASEDVVISFARTGDKGDTGFTGSKGDQGIQGDTGFTGSQGDTGASGSDGATGFTGSKGDKGDTGNTGFTGSKGDTGDTGGQGDTGFTGSKGDQGDQGDTGFTGSKGDTGASGSDGATGFTGSKGDKGDTGDTGFTGSKGDQGDTGGQGDTGFTGSKGDKGDTGDTGFTGSKGDTGDTGAQGDTGFTGSKGDKGDQGDIGFTGSQGPTGFTGSQGVGFTGSRGYTGSQGYTGSRGADGNFGGATFDYTFSTTTTNSDPGTGTLRFNNATVSSATAMYIDDTDDNATDIQTFLRTIDDSTSTIKGHFRVSNRLNADDFALFTISSISEQTGYFVVNCSFVSGSASAFTNGEDVIITFARTGDKGDTGFTGSASTVAGPTGFTGSKGDTGASGSDGATGFTGSKGDTGATGFTGSKGDTGFTGSRGAAITTSTTAPTSPSDGDLWWDEEVGSLFIYYVDANTSQWVEASPAASPFSYNSNTDTYTLPGNLTVQGDIDTTSDITLKENIETFTDALEVISQMRGVNFNWIESGKPSIGLIAQEVDQVLPELVGETDGKLTVQYSNIVAVLIEAVKELTAKVQELENK